jgi:hypothetical protein
MHGKVHKAVSKLLKMGYKKSDFRFTWMNMDRPAVQLSIPA